MSMKNESPSNDKNEPYKLNKSIQNFAIAGLVSLLFYIPVVTNALDQSECYFTTGAGGGPATGQRTRQTNFVKRVYFPHTLQYAL